MSDSLTVFGVDYTGVTGIKATGTGNGTLTYIRPTGTKSISANGTGIDVTEYASVDVAVVGGGDLVVTLTNVNGVWTPDKTLAEIAEAYGDGVKIAVMADDNSVVADGIFGDDDNCFYYTVDYFDNITNAYTTQWYILDSNGITDDGNVVYYSTVFATAVASDIAQGKTAYGPNGEIVGTATPATPTLQAKTNISPTTSSQTITADSGYDGLSSVQINAMPSGTAGTPSATKGTVSNHAVSVTPSVTNTTGYITGSTKTGTAVSVSASELVSGSYTVSASGTHDVTNYASASVAAGGATASATKGSVSNHSVTVTPSVTRTAGYVTAGSANGTAVTVSASELVSGSETKTSNGTYDVTNLASVTVDIDFVTYYVSSSNPTSSQGSDGDIWLVTA